VLREKIGCMATKDRWVAITSLLSATVWIAFALKVAAQSSLSTTYTTADAWDCAGSQSCPKPIGTVDGKNTVFTLRGAPTGPASVRIFVNGLYQRITVDPQKPAAYTLTTNSSGAYTVVTFTKAPNPGDEPDFLYRENVRANVLPQ
jgi:hypothetical protein